MNAKKVVSIITLGCFVYSSILAQGLAAAVERGQSARQFAQVLDDFVIPHTAGRITASKDYGSAKVVVNVQDLHCHPEVQRNIARILSILDSKYKLKKVYVEGAAGAVDTSWLTDMKDRTLKKELVETLVDQGKLTGTEYYSITSGRPDLLRGIEDEALYRANLLRLKKILDKKDGYEETVALLKKDLAVMKGRYFSARNERLEKMLQKYRTGQMDAGKYYSFLKKYTEKLNDGSSNNIARISMAQYPNVAGYMALMEQGEHLRYKNIARQLQEFVQVLKQKLPYNAYNLLLQKTDNFTRLDELYLYLARLAGEYKLDLSVNYPQLNEFFRYLDKSQQINPLVLVREEKRLVENIRAGLSRDMAELEVSFLADFMGYFEDYLFNRLSAADYEYFMGRFGQFKLLWAKYADKNRLAALEDDFAFLDDYYRVNIERNDCFIRTIAEGNAVPAARARGAEAADAVEALAKADEITVVVTGGFHTQGLEKLLDERQITHLAITPNVTQDTKKSDLVYIELARQQAKILEQALALQLLSKLGPETQWRAIAEAKLSSMLARVERSKFEKTLNVMCDQWNASSDKQRKTKISLESVIEKDGKYDFLFKVVPDNGENGRALMFRADKEGRVEFVNLQSGEAYEGINTADRGAKNKTLANTMAVGLAAATVTGATAAAATFVVAHVLTGGFIAIIPLAYYGLTGFYLWGAGDGRFDADEGLIDEFDSLPDTSKQLSGYTAAQAAKDGIQINADLMQRLPRWLQRSILNHERTHLKLAELSANNKLLTTLLAIPGLEECVVSFTEMTGLFRTGSRPGMKKIENTPKSPEGGFIGKYQIMSDPVFDGKRVHFAARDLETGLPTAIEIDAIEVDGAVKMPSALRTAADADRIVKNVVDWGEQGFAGKYLLLRDNDYGIQGLGTKDIIAVHASLQDNAVALFHEMGEAMGAYGFLSAEDIVEGGALSERGLSWYFGKMEDPARLGMDLHYALRALQREHFTAADERLTSQIRETRAAVQGTEGPTKVVSRQAGDERTRIRRVLDQYAAAFHRSPTAFVQDDETLSEPLLKELDEYNPALIAETLLEFRIEVLARSGWESMVLLRLLPEKISRAARVAPMVGLHLYHVAMRSSGLKAAEKRKLVDYLLAGLKNQIVPDSEQYRTIVDSLMRDLSALERISIPARRLDGLNFNKDYYFDPDTRDSDRLYFKQDFNQRVARVSEISLASALTQLHDEAYFNRLALELLCVQLIKNDESGYFNKSLLARVTADVLSDEAKAAMVTLLVRHWNINYVTQDLTRTIDDIVMEGSKQKTVLLTTILYLYKMTPRPDIRERLMKDLLEFRNEIDSLENREIVTQFIKEEMEGVSKELKKVSSALRKADDEYKTALAEQNSDAFNALLLLKTKRFYARQAALMAQVQGFTKILLPIVREAFQSPDAGNQEFAAGLLQYLVKVARSDTWGKETSSEIISELSELIPASPEIVTTSFISLFKLKQAQAKNMRQLLSGNATARDLVEALRALSGGDRRDERLAYLIILKYGERGKYLKEIVRDPAVDGRFKIYAFVHLTKFLRPGNAADEALFKDLTKELCDEAARLIGSRIAVADAGWLDALFEDTLFQDEEAKVYVMATLLVLKEKVSSIDLRTFAHITQYNIARARLTPYWDNANSALNFGGRNMRQSPVLFFQVIAHELGHDILEYRDPDQLLESIFHEFVADVYAFALSDVFNVAYNGFVDRLRYTSHYESVSGNDYYTIEGHEGARAMLKIIIDEHQTIAGEHPAWKTMLEAAAHILKTTRDEEDAENIASRILQEYVALKTRQGADKDAPRDLLEQLDDFLMSRNYTDLNENIVEHIGHRIPSPDSVRDVLSRLVSSPLSILDPIFKAVSNLFFDQEQFGKARTVTGFRKVFNLFGAAPLETLLFLHFVSPLGIGHLIAIGFFGFVAAHILSDVVVSALSGESIRDSLRSSIEASGLKPFFTVLVLLPVRVLVDIAVNKRSFHDAVKRGREWAPEFSYSLAWGAAILLVPYLLPLPLWLSFALAVAIHTLFNAVDLKKEKIRHNNRNLNDTQIKEKLLAYIDSIKYDSLKAEILVRHAEEYDWSLRLGLSQPDAEAMANVFNNALRDYEANGYQRSDSSPRRILRFIQDIILDDIDGEDTRYGRQEEEERDYGREGYERGNWRRDNSQWNAHNGADKNEIQALITKLNTLLSSIHAENAEEVETAEEEIISIATSSNAGLNMILQKEAYPAQAEYKAALRKMPPELTTDKPNIFVASAVIETIVKYLDNEVVSVSKEDIEKLARARAMEMLEINENDPGEWRDILKKAYRKLARQYHPDVYKGPLGAIPFKRISVAYEFLSPASLLDPLVKRIFNVSPQSYEMYTYFIAPAWEEFAFRFVGLGLIGKVTLASILALNLPALGSVLGVSVVGFAASHVIVRWLTDRNAYPDLPSFAKGMLPYLGPATLFTAAYLGIMAAVSLVCPVTPVAHLVAYLGSTAIHSLYNRSAVQDAADRRPVASIINRQDEKDELLADVANKINEKEIQANGTKYRVIATARDNLVIQLQEKKIGAKEPSTAVRVTKDYSIEMNLDDELRGQGIVSSLFAMLSDALPEGMNLQSYIMNIPTRESLFQKYRYDKATGRVVTKADNPAKEIVVVDKVLNPANEISLEQVLEETLMGKLYRKAGLGAFRIGMDKMVAGKGLEYYEGVAALKELLQNPRKGYKTTNREIKDQVREFYWYATKLKPAFVAGETVTGTGQDGKSEKPVSRGIVERAAPDLPGQEVSHADRNRQLEARISDNEVFRVKADGRVSLEQYKKKSFKNAVEQAFYFLFGSWIGQLQRWSQAIPAGNEVRSNVEKKLERIRSPGGIIDKLARDPERAIKDLQLGDMVAELRKENPALTGEGILQQLIQIAKEADLLIVKGRLTLHQDGPFAHARRGVGVKGGRAIWLGEKLFTVEGITEHDIALLLVEEAKHILAPNLNHDIIVHSRSLEMKLVAAAKDAGQTVRGICDVERDIENGGTEDNIPGLRESPDFGDGSSFFNDKRETKAAYKRLLDCIVAIEKGKYQKKAVVDLRGVNQEVILVGDLHGRADNLQRILDENGNRGKIERGDAVLIILGDAVHNEVDLGEMDSSVEIMKAIMDLKVRNRDQVYYLLGNHDYLSDRFFKGGVFQGLKYKETLQNRYGPEYVEIYKEFIRISPVMVIGNGFVAAHGGPAKSASSWEQIRDVDVSQENNAIVRELEWGRYQNRDHYYDTGDVKAFMRRMGQPHGYLINGHTNPSDGNWRYQPDADNDRHHVIIASRDRVGYLRMWDGAMEPVELPGRGPVENTEPEVAKPEQQLSLNKDDDVKIYIPKSRSDFRSVNGETVEGIIKDIMQVYTLPLGFVVRMAQAATTVWSGAERYAALQEAMPGVAGSLVYYREGQPGGDVAGSLQNAVAIGVMSSAVTGAVKLGKIEVPVGKNEKVLADIHMAVKGKKVVLYLGFPEGLGLNEAILHAAEVALVKEIEGNHRYQEKIKQTALPASMDGNAVKGYKLVENVKAGEQENMVKLLGDALENKKVEGVTRGANFLWKMDPESAKKVSESGEGWGGNILISGCFVENKPVDEAGLKAMLADLHTAGYGVLGEFVFEGEHLDLARAARVEEKLGKDKFDGCQLDLRGMTGATAADIIPWVNGIGEKYPDSMITLILPESLQADVRRGVARNIHVVRNLPVQGGNMVVESGENECISLEVADGADWRQIRSIRGLVEVSIEDLRKSADKLFPDSVNSILVVLNTVNLIKSLVQEDPAFLYRMAWNYADKDVPGAEAGDALLDAVRAFGAGKYLGGEAAGLEDVKQSVANEGGQERLNDLVKRVSETGEKTGGPINVEIQSLVREAETAKDGEAKGIAAAKLVRFAAGICERALVKANLAAGNREKGFQDNLSYKMEYGKLLLKSRAALADEGRPQDAGIEGLLRYVSASLLAGHYDQAFAGLKDVNMQLTGKEDIHLVLRYIGLAGAYYARTGFSGYESSENQLLGKAALQLRDVRISALDTVSRAQYYNAIKCLGMYREDVAEIAPDDTAPVQKALSLDELKTLAGIRAYVELKENNGVLDERELGRAVNAMRALAKDSSQPVSELLWVLDLYASRRKVEIDKKSKTMMPDMKSTMAMLGAA